MLQSPDVAMTFFSTLFTDLTGLFIGWLRAFYTLIERSTNIPASEVPDSWLGLAMSALAGAAAGLAVAIALSVYFRTGQRSFRDVTRHGFAVVAVLGLLAFALSDIRRTAQSYLGINSAAPAVEFEIRLPKNLTTASAAGDSQIELHTDRNQILAHVRDELFVTEDGRNVLRGSVPLKFRTTQRAVVVNLPGEPQRLFKLRLAASPSHSNEFGPWHLPDEVASSTGKGSKLTVPNDAFAIRYRVL
jgi:hypothetical protein